MPDDRFHQEMGAQGQRQAPERPFTGALSLAKRITPPMAVTTRPAAVSAVAEKHMYPTPLI